MSRAERTRYEVLVLPRASLVRTAATTSAASLGPVLLALLWLSVPTGPWPAVVAAGVLALLVAAAAHARFRTVFAGVTPTHLVKRGFLTPLRQLPRSELAEVVRVDTYRGDATETVHQIVGLSHDGACVYRMRGTFWSDDALDGLVEALDVPVTLRDRPVPLRELYRSWPDCRYWYEGRRWLTVAAAVVGTGIVGAALVLLFRVVTPG